MHRLSDLQTLPFIVACGTMAIVLGLSAIATSIRSLTMALREAVQELRRIGGSK